jgi:hypothetical protein
MAGMGPVSELRTGDLVSFKLISSKEKFRLGIVIRIHWDTRLIKIKWCDGSVSLHSEIFLKRIA